MRVDVDLSKDDFRERTDIGRTSVQDRRVERDLLESEKDRPEGCSPQVRKRPERKPAQASFVREECH